MVETEGSLAGYFWSWEPDHREGAVDGEFTVPATTPTSTALAKDLKKRGWTFVGPTTVYAFMQAMGLVNDHLPECAARTECEGDPTEVDGKAYRVVLAVVVVERLHRVSPESVHLGGHDEKE